MYLCKILYVKFYWTFSFQVMPSVAFWHAYLWISYQRKWFLDSILISKSFKTQRIRYLHMLLMRKKLHKLHLLMTIRAVSALNLQNCTDSDKKLFEKRILYVCSLQRMHSILSLKYDKIIEKEREILDFLNIFF